MSALNDFNDELWAQDSIHKIISRAMARPDAATFKFDYTMVEANRALWDWAAYAIDQYHGTFDMMVSFQTQARLGKQMSPKQCAVALNTLLRCWKNSLEEAKTAQVAAGAFDQVVDFEQIPSSHFSSSGKANHNVVENITSFKVPVQRPHDGTYTFVDQSGDYRVIRFRTDPKSGDTFVSYQYGSDNESDFAKCGKINKNSDLVVWMAAFDKGHKVSQTSDQRADLMGAITFICSFEKEAQLKAGEAYALKSGNCFICGRTLTVPSSISAGIGPVCAEKWGL